MISPIFLFYLNTTAIGAVDTTKDKYYFIIDRKLMGRLAIFANHTKPTPDGPFDQAITFKHYLNGVLTNSTSNQKITQNCLVLRTEDVQVPAGSFQTFVIRRTDSGGSSSDIYYSEKAHRQVKELDYMSGGSLAFSLELLDYSVAEPTTSPVPTPTPTQTPQSIPTQQPTATETPSPSIPELSWLTVLPLLLFSLLTIIVIKKKK